MNVEYGVDELRDQITAVQEQLDLCCNKVKRFPCGGSRNHAGIMEGWEGGGGEGRRRGGGGKVGGIWEEGGGRGGGGGKVEAGVEVRGRSGGGRDIRMNHGAFPRGGLHFVTARLDQLGGNGLGSGGGAGAVRGRVNLQELVHVAADFGVIDARHLDQDG